MSQEKLIEIKNLIEGADLSLQQAKNMLAGLVGDETAPVASKASHQGSHSADGTGNQVIEGVFDGQHMVGPDGKQYSIPANYASKSKLVEGDLLKLTIDARGHFMYKQIGPIERTRLKGTLTQDEQTSEWRVVADGKAYKVILASVTYFKGEQGDEVTIMVPQDKSSSWAAVENIYKHGQRPESSVTPLSSNASIPDARTPGSETTETAGSGFTPSAATSKSPVPESAGTTSDEPANTEKAVSSDAQSNTDRYSTPQSPLGGSLPPLSSTTDTEPAKEPEPEYPTSTPPAEPTPVPEAANSINPSETPLNQIHDPEPTPANQGTQGVESNTPPNTSVSFDDDADEFSKI